MIKKQVPTVLLDYIRLRVNLTDGFTEPLIEAHLQSAQLYCTSFLQTWLDGQPNKQMPSASHPHYKEAVYWETLRRLVIVSPNNIAQLVDAEPPDHVVFQQLCKTERDHFLRMIVGKSSISAPIGKKIPRPRNFWFDILLLLLLLAPLGAEASDRYDAHFKRASRTYFSTAVPWRWLKAQGMQESALRPNVCSPVGACGLMQFMPGTAKDFRLNPFDARASIYASADYMERLRRNWSAPRPAWDKHALALGSYNWGLGNMLKVQRKTNAQLWHQFEPVIPNETAEYAPRIRTWCQHFNQGVPCWIGR